MNSKNKKKRNTEYIDLIKTTEKVLGYARTATERIMQSQSGDKAFEKSGSIGHYADLTKKVINHSRRPYAASRRCSSHARAANQGYRYRILPDKLVPAFLRRYRNTDSLLRPIKSNHYACRHVHDRGRDHHCFMVDDFKKTLCNISDRSP